MLVKLLKNFVINFSFLKELLFNESLYFLLCIYTNRIFGKNWVLGQNVLQSSDCRILKFLKNYLQPETVPQSGQCFRQLYLKNINFLTKTKRCFYAEFYEFKTKMTGKGKQNHIFQKSKSYEISSTVRYIGEGQKFIIHVFY